LSAKRLFDFLVAGPALLVLSPVLGAIALLIRWRMGRPLFFRQARPGLNGVPFEMIKFRTMDVARPGADGVESDERRLTPLGRFLRATSLDELPELWNILRGDKSLVGPRPLLMQYLDRYTPEQARRHLVRPGLTGWAQVNGRNAISWDEKFALDVWYVDNRTFWLDIKILFLTAKHVVAPAGISAEGAATMPEFMGSSPESESGPDRR
jgi:lipopolysaccharide/colanic/teichoic acid biosynthesis glycosyltransferase